MPPRHYACTAKIGTREAVEEDRRVKIELEPLGSMIDLSGGLGIWRGFYWFRV